MLTFFTALVQVLPTLIQGGYNIYSLIQHASGVTATTPVDQFIASELPALTSLLESGVDIAGRVTALQAAVAAMVAENRGPNQAEKDAQTARLAAGDTALDKAAAPGV